MGEREALKAAVLADPDDDLPRLVFADWLDENGETDAARFIRAQIALAALPEWDPQSVALRRTQAEWDCTEALASGQSQVWTERGLQWVDHDRFRRGFGYYIRVPHVHVLQTRMPELLADVPIQRLGLYAATLDQYREFADSRWLSRIREIDFEGLSSPIEAMIALTESHRSYGLHALRFLSAVSPAIPELLDRLARSPVGDRLRTLELAQAFGSDASYFEDFREAFQMGLTRLKTLGFRSMGFGGDQLFEFFTARRWNDLEELSIIDAGPGPAGLSFLSYPDCWPALRAVKLDGVNVTARTPEYLANSLRAPNLVLLDVANSPISAQNFNAIARAEHLKNLRVVRVRKTTCDNRGVRYLAHSKFWKNLVELDLRSNPIDENGAKHLLARKPPEHLELLRIDDRFPEEMRTKLIEHFEEKVVFDAAR